MQASSTIIEASKYGFNQDLMCWGELSDWKRVLFNSFPNYTWNRWSLWWVHGSYANFWIFMLFRKCVPIR